LERSSGIGRTSFAGIARSLDEWARWIVQSNRTVKGTKVDEHLSAFAKLKGQAAPEPAKEPQVPWVARGVQQLFMELNSTRQSGMSVGPITFTEIKAMVELLDLSLEPWEIDGIRLCDRAFLAELSKVMEAP
jgi:hypothetical protein